MAQPKRFVVAKGISTHGERGILDQGTEVTPDDFEGGKAAFEELVMRGVLVPATAAKPEEPAPAPVPQEAAATPEPATPEPAPPSEPTQESANARQSRARAVR